MHSVCAWLHRPARKCDAACILKTANLNTSLLEVGVGKSAPRIAVPAWVTKITKRGVEPVKALASLGAKVMVGSVLHCGGVPAVSRAAGDASPSAEGLNRYLRNLPGRSLVLEERLPARYAYCVAERLAQRVAAEGGLFGKCESPALAMCELIEAVLTSVGMVTGRAEDDAASKCFTPLDVLSAIAANLKFRSDEVCMDALDARCVVASGIAYRGLLDMRRCLWCFRWAWPGQQSCAQHSLSAEVGGTRQQRQARYEEAKRVCGHLSAPTFSQSPRYHRMSDREALWVIARLLFSPTLVREEEVLVKLVSAVHRSPCLMAAAMVDQVDFGLATTSKVAEEVRNWLDPLEYRPRVLVQEIHAGERWYRAAEIALPGKRGPGRAK